MRKSYLSSPAGLLFILALVAAFSCTRSPEPVKYSGFAQGTTFLIRYYGETDSTALFRQIDSVFRLVDGTASLYDSNSLISRVNRNEEVQVNSLFLSLFTRSVEISEETDGAFDMTVGPLVRAWGFYRKKNQELSGQQVDSLKHLVGYRQVTLDGNRIVKQMPEIRLDFNAIAQGFTVDLLAALLEQHDIRNYVVEVGGEVRTGGEKPGHKPWVVGIEQPSSSDSSGQVIQQKIALPGRAAATSGNYRKFFIRDGIKYSHTIDPFTGYPVRHSLLSVTVIADDCMTADAYATACMVMGKEKALEFLSRHPGTEAYFISGNTGGDHEVFYTAGFEKYLVPN